MADQRLNFLCLVDGESTSFPVGIESTTIGDLKDEIKAKTTPRFDDVAVAELTLWRVSIPLLPKKDRKDISLGDIPSKEELDETDDLSEVFPDKLPKKTIHVIVQRPPPVHVPVPSRALTPLPGSLSDGSPPSTPLSGDLHADIKKITDKFLAPGSQVANFLDAFVKGQGALPTTIGPIRGLPSAWRRGFGRPPGTRPSLLFMDLPDPSAPDSESRNLAAGSILSMVKGNNRYHIPSVWCCGKTRAVIELLSQHWGFYFSAADDDWGSGDMMTLYNTVRSYLKDIQVSSAVEDREINNLFARKTTLLLFLSRLLVFKYCISVPSSSETFTSARWALLQVCAHVLFKDMFNELFLKLLNLQHHGELPLSLLIRNVYEDTKDRLIVRGCLPKIKDGTRLLVVNDEAQFLGDQFNGFFQSKSSSDDFLRPLLSGSELKDGSKNFEFMEFPGFTDLQSIKAYMSRVRRCMLDDESRRVFDERIPQEALDMLFSKFVGRYRPAIVAVEKIMEHSEHGSWKALIEGTEDKLVAWKYRTIKGNLCRELNRLDQKHKDTRDDASEDTVLDILGKYFYNRCFRGEHKLEDDSVNTSLVECAFGRINIVGRNAVTVVDEPFVFKAVENYFSATDPGFQTALRELMDRTDAAAKGNLFERYMMTVFSKTFKSRRLSDWPHQPPILQMCSDLVGELDIVGWREPALLQGTTHEMMSMEEFMDAHVNHHSTRNNTPVAPFFFPKHKPSGPDMSSTKLYNKLWENALATVSASCIQDHVKDFHNFCPDNIYISMVVAYPMVCGTRLPAVKVPEKDERGLQQVMIRVCDTNFGQIFPEEHVKFINRLKNAGKRTANDADNDNEDRSKKLRT
ncbi:hypothetical protein EC957_010545 [Mortierella hygrophila]|uniref:Crinkler effector protein N-terminal domain-containing protein n=1 Tax=Mortierella hygrophila TaxID=979708 RepID=A0A9P6JXC1_9FUNG|nr:hypothetical protein EC957_010545 [Mortierella hygrophila]